MSLREAQQSVSERVGAIPGVRRVYVQLGRTPRIIVDLCANSTSATNAVNAALGTLDCELPIEVIHSDSDSITSDVAQFE